MKRNTGSTAGWSRKFRLDPRSTDELHWIEAILAEVMPDVRLSQSTIVRRALESYAAYLGNAFCDRKVDHRNVVAESAHFLSLKQDNPVYWPDGTFPADQIRNTDGTLKRFDMMHRQARDEFHRQNLSDLLEGKKGSRNGV